MTTPGWQQPARQAPLPSCLHLGVLGASFTVASHAEGHEWVCGCGQVFKVIRNGDGRKVLAKTNEIRPIRKADA